MNFYDFAMVFGVIVVLAFPILLFLQYKKTQGEIQKRILEAVFAFLDRNFSSHEKSLEFVLNKMLPEFIKVSYWDWDKLIDSFGEDDYSNGKLVLEFIRERRLKSV